MFWRIVPSKRNSSCKTTPKCFLKLPKLTFAMSSPSTVIIPDCGFKKVAAKPAMVLFPDPELPTRAMTSPDLASKLML